MLNISEEALAISSKEIELMLATGLAFWPHG
jgi:hypothetical protein